jgi:hypothetical protein
MASTAITKGMPAHLAMQLVVTSGDRTRTHMVAGGLNGLCSIEHVNIIANIIVNITGSFSS